MQKQYRLKKNASFNYIYNKGKSVANKYMVLVYVKSYQNVKIGFSVSKKVGNSVVRNHTKRLMKESIRTIIPKINQHTHYIFIARPFITNLDYHKVLECEIDLLKKAKLYMEE